MANSTGSIIVDPRAIAAAGQGWVRYTPSTVPRMLIASQAWQGSGKTHFGFTMPGPLAVINLDDGLETVADKFVRRGKQVAVRNLKIDPRRKMGPDDWDAAWYAVRDAYLWAVTCGQFRSVLVDTGNAVWEYVRMAEFGKLAQIPPLKYTEVNNTFEAWVRVAYDYPVNVTFTHRQSAVYANDAAGRGNKTGEVQAKGYKDIGYVLQVEIEQTWVPALKAPALRVKKCRYDITQMGLELYAGECTFAGLGMKLFPGTRPEDWSDGTEVGL